MPTPTLTTERLVLRPIRMEDAPAIQEHFAHWSIIQHLSEAVPWPYPEDGAIQHLKRALPRIEASDDMSWAIIVREADQLIGVIDYMAEDSGSGNRGFWLAGPWQGRGYMTEAVHAMQDYLFFELQLDRILVGNAIDNPASRRIKEKTGARLLGTDQFAHRNGCVETERWEVTRESWAKLRGRQS